MIRHRLLLVDDEPDIVSGIEQILESLPLDIFATTDSETAENKIATEDFDIILSDIAMPKVNGFELLEQSVEKNPDVVFIMITGYGSVESAVNAMHKLMSSRVVR